MYVCVHVRMSTYVCMYVCMYVYVCIYICTYVCMYEYVCIYICMYFFFIKHAPLPGAILHAVVIQIQLVFYRGCSKKTN